MIFYSAYLMIYKAGRKGDFFYYYCVSQFDKVDILQLFWGIFMHMRLLLNLVR